MHYTYIIWFFDTSTYFNREFSKLFSPRKFYQLFTIAQNSFFISFTTATIIILLSLILTVSIKYQNFKGFNFLSTIAGIGYAFPGIIIALGTLFFISFIEKFINLSLEIFLLI